MANALLLEPLPVASVTSPHTAPGHDAANLTSDFMGLTWKSTSVVAPRLVVDLGEDVPFDTVALFGIEGRVDLATWTVEVATESQGSGFAGAWSTGSMPLLAGSVLPTSGRGKALAQLSGAPSEARFLRITFGSLTGSEPTLSLRFDTDEYGVETEASSLSIARLVVSSGLTLDRNFRFGAAFGVRPLGETDFSVRGVLLRRPGRKLRGVGISFPHIRRDEVEARIQPLLERVGNDTAIAIVTDPAPDAQRQNRMYLGFLTGDLGTIWARPGGFAADFNLVAID